MKELKQKIDEARELLLKAQKILAEIPEDEEIKTQDVDSWYRQRLELWARIYNEGGIVTKETLHNIWNKTMKKKTGWGLGGFFKGTNASLQRTHDDKIILTKKASEMTEAWARKTLEEYSKQFTKK